MLSPDAIVQLLRREYARVELVRKQEILHIEINRIVLLSLREAEALAKRECSLKRIIADRWKRPGSFFPEMS